MKRATRVFFVFVVLIAPGCKGCDKPSDKVAELIATTKIVEKDLATAGDEWNPAKVGESFVMNDAVRTGPTATARVKLAGGGGLRLAPGTMIRFGKDASGLAVETGEAELETVDAFLLDMDIGVANIEGKSRVRLRAADGKIRFDVLVGSASFEESDGTVTTLNPGDGFDLDIGAAVFERDIKGRPDAQPAAVPTVDASAATVNATVRGRGVQTKEGDAQWQDVAAGERKIAEGARVRVPKGASVKLKRGNERATVAGSGEFVVGQRGGVLLSAESGRTTVDAKRGAVTINVPGGSIVVRKKSTADIDVDKEQLASVFVRKGSAEVNGADSAETLGSKESAVLGKDGVVEVTTGQGKLSPPPSREADFGVRVGESLTIHDPKPPTVLSFRIAAKCREAGVLELVRRGSSFRRAKTRVKGKGSIAVEIPKGRHSYRLQCGRKTAASGSITVLRDSGTVAIPKRPPRSTLDTDGRRYTVLYQNLLPIVTIRWKKAPSGAFKLILIDDKSKKNSYRATGKSYTFDSGKISEGSYTYYFQSTTTRKSSPKTSVSIRFDNAAPKAYVRHPKNSAAWTDTIKVSGVTLKGWKVVVEGKPLKIDRHRRFSTEISRPNGALAIRFSRSGRGVHYYIRRSAASGASTP